MWRNGSAARITPFRSNSTGASDGLGAWNDETTSTGPR